jgi:hypothetical protein
LELTEQILSNNGTDPVGLWFKGMAILQGDTPRKRYNALKYLRLGLKYGIEKWFPVTDEMKRLVVPG